MRYFILAVVFCTAAAAGPVFAEESISRQINRACMNKDNADHPVCVDRANKRAKAKAAREAKEQAMLDSILGRDPAKPTH